MRSSSLLLAFAALGVVALVFGLWFARSSESPATPAALERGLAKEDRGPSAARELSASAALAQGADSDGSARTSSDGGTALPATTERTPRPKRLVSGRVVDEFGGAVVAARVVFALPRGMSVQRIDQVSSEHASLRGIKETLTDTKGCFEFEFARGSRVRIAVRSSGFVPLRVVRELPASGPAKLEDLVLAESVRLFGHVVDTSGRPVLGAKFFDISSAAGSGPILLNYDGEPLCVSDESGAFRLDELAPGPYNLRVGHPSHPAEGLQGHIARASESPQAQRIVLADGFEIAGRVLGLEPGEERELVVRARPAGGHAIGSLGGALGLGGDSRMAALDASGEFLLGGLRGGQSYSLSAVDKVEGAGLGSPIFSSPRSTAVLAAAGTRGVELELREAGVLVFRVVDGASGEPIEDFEVEAGSPWLEPLQDEQGLTITHHSGGRVRFANVRQFAGDNKVSLALRAEGYQTLNLEDLALSPGRDSDLGVLRLVAVAKVRVLVLDAASLEPVLGARVALRPVREDGALGLASSFLFSALAEGGSDDFDLPTPPFFGRGELVRGRSDSEGRVELDSLSAKRFDVFVEHRKYAAYTSDPLELSALGAAEVEVRMAQGGTVVVLVLAADGEPFVGARVRHRAPGEGRRLQMFGGGRKTRKNGELSFRHLEAGRHVFSLPEAGAKSAGDSVISEILILGEEESDALPRGALEVLVSEGSRDEITLRAAPLGSLSGRVTETGQSLAGATLVFEHQGAEQALVVFMPGMPAGPQAQTDGKGAYSLEDLAVGRYSVRISHPTRAMHASFDLDLAAGHQTCDFPLALTRLEGRVLDDKGRGVPGVEVSAQRAGDEGAERQPTMFIMGDGGGSMGIVHGASAAPPTITEADGFYSLRGVAPDVEVYVQTRSASHQAARSKSVSVGAGQTLGGIDIDVFAAGRIAVLVVDAVGSPAYFCMVQAVFEGESDGPVDDRREFVGEGGSASLRSLKPGPWRLTVSALDRGPSGSAPANHAAAEPQVVEVRSGEQASVTLVLP
jgi:protocatechuate 3,4-dioxygenase beta subunit